MDVDALIQLIDLGEGKEIEFKSSENALSKDLWETLSAFANTDGGYIILGVTEQKGGLIEITGVNNPQARLKEFWDAHNNPEKLNTPICTNSDVNIQTIDERALVIITVPRATRSLRPIYIKNNPMTGTFKRNHEGDYRCTQDEIKQMLRDASNDPQDLQILEGFSIADLDSETLKAFRQRFSSREPDHPWLALDDQNLLYQLGGWRHDRNTAQEGITVAGLLMFGRERSILDALPHYQLDYRERLSDNPEERWTYRLTLDGKWEPNLFNFYYRVYGRLVSDLTVPFKLDKDAVRLGETHIHEALREALVNALVHADHLSTRPLQIFKRLEGFIFSNPGRLRIPIQQLYEGGVTDPRNPNLQKMFQMLGLGEKAGSGFQKILRAWQEQQWLIPLVSEKLDLEITAVFLPMLSFIPEDIETELKEVVGSNYSELPELDRFILVLTHQFGEVSNIDIQRYRKEHRRDIGDCLKQLVTNGYLEQSGRGRWTHYKLLSPSITKLSASQLDLDYVDNEASFEHNEPSSEHNEPSSERSDRELLLAIAEPIRQKKRVTPNQMRNVILQLCQDRFLLLKALAELLNRSPDTLRTHYINPMLQERSLELKYPEQPSHPQQAYKTVLDTQVSHTD